MKSNTLILTWPVLNGVVGYARDHIPIQEPYKDTISWSITQNQTIFVFNVKIMYKTKDTLVRNTKSEEHSMVKTKLVLKMYLQKVKSDVKSEI